MADRPDRHGVVADQLERSLKKLSMKENTQNHENFFYILGGIGK